MKKFIFKSVEHGDTVYVDRLDYRALVNRFLLLQEVAEATIAFFDVISPFDPEWFTKRDEVAKALTVLQQEDGVS